ncbi:Txe/YoeB family addiction module toxin [Saccharicrinis fermentans]|uniref:Txe/YoeB family addiction module toxin n=1 Tax=Saccharicrinis fermentans TaxID=982 RepID=UPI00047F78DE|nr:Txe/YoeB family addiction module toxin [Saccharicrinis fermentans]
MSYVLEFTETALADIKKHRKVGDKAVLRKMDNLLKELMEHPLTGTGQPKPLKHSLTGIYSRRINGKHRLVYSIEEEKITVHVLSTWGHYGDK